MGQKSSEVQQDDSKQEVDNKCRPRANMLIMYLTDVTLRNLRGRAREGNPLVLAGELVGGVDFHVAGMAESSLVRAAEQGGLRHVANAALYLHLLNHWEATQTPHQKAQGTPP